MFTVYLILPIGMHDMIDYLKLEIDKISMSNVQVPPLHED